MERNVTYKALLYLLLGSVAGVLSMIINANSKFEQIDENKTHIEALSKQHIEDLKAVYVKVDANANSMQKNQIEIIKGIAGLELLIEKNNK